MDSNREIHLENEELRRQLEESQDALRAIRQGKVDAIVVEGEQGTRIFSLTGAETVYRLAVETMSEAAINVTLDGRILFCNARFVEYVGTPMEQVIGRNLAEFVPPGDVEILRIILQQCAQGPVKRRIVLRTADGSLRPVHLTGRALEQPGLPSLCLVAADLSEIETSAQRIDLLQEHQRAMEKADIALEQARANAIEEKYRLEAIMEALPVGLCIVDSRGGNVRSNPAFEQIWGNPRPAVNDVSDYTAYKAWWVDTGMLVQPEEWASARAVQKGETVVGQLMQIARFDGTCAFIHNSATPILDAGGRVVGGAVAIMDITHELESQEALREARDYLQNLIDYANAPIIVWDPAFRITRFNHAFELLTGRSAKDVVGKPLDILFPDESREESSALIRRTQTGERWETVEIPILRRDGTVRTVLWNSATLFAQDGKSVTATIAQGQDVTERREAEEERKLYLKSLEILADCATGFLKRWTSFEIFEYIAQKIGELAREGVVVVTENDPVDQARIVRGFAGNQDVHRMISSVLGRELIGLRLVSNSQLGEKLVQGSLLHLKGGVRQYATEQFPESLCLELSETCGLRDLYAVPIMWENDLLGSVVILTGSKMSGRNVRVIETFVNQAAIALNRVRTDEALRQREHEYRTLMEDASDGIVLVDPEGRVIAANSRACELSGYTQEELSSIPAIEFVPPEQLPLLRDGLRDIVAGKSAIVEHRVRRKDGSHLYVETSARRLADGRYQAILRDITDRKRAEEEFTRAVQSEVFDRLITSLREFHHGEGLAMNLQRLALFGKNYQVLVAESGRESNGSASPTDTYAHSRLEVAVQEYFTVGYPRLREIASLLRAVQEDINQKAVAGEEPVLAGDLFGRSEFLKADLEELLRAAHRSSESRAADGGGVGERIVDHVQNIIRTVDALIRSLNGHYASDVSEVVKTIVSSVRSTSPGTVVDVREEVQDLKAIISPADLGEVLAILLRNSVEAPAGIDGDGKRITIRLGRRGARARIEVEDNGEGVRAEVRGSLFSEAGTTKGPGRGHGLSFAQKHLRKYNGTLAYDGLYQSGARFVIELVLM